MRHGHNQFVTQRNAFGVLLLILITLLNGCATLSTKDGPPPYPVDASSIPNAQPKTEKLSKYGNLSSYQVFGKNYHVMSSAKNYEETGIASWYGTKFHKLRTSSGERYNMLAMTAAHKTLPLPTYVEVTNLRNGNKIIVKVNDRGPFASNRLIDLSYVAAKKLGMVGHGTTYVRVKAIDPQDAYQHPHLLARNKTKSFEVAKQEAVKHKEKLQKAVHVATHSGATESKIQLSKNTPSTTSSKQILYIQVGAFKNRVYAEQLKKRLSPLLPSPVAITPLAHASNKLYRVKIGPIKDLSSADSIKKKLRSLGLTAQSLRA